MAVVHLQTVVGQMCTQYKYSIYNTKYKFLLHVWIDFRGKHTDFLFYIVFCDVVVVTGSSNNSWHLQLFGHYLQIQTPRHQKSWQSHWSWLRADPAVPPTSGNGDTSDDAQKERMLVFTKTCFLDSFPSSSIVYCSLSLSHVFGGVD